MREGEIDPNGEGAGKIHRKETCSAPDAAQHARGDQPDHDLFAVRRDRASDDERPPGRHDSDVGELYRRHDTGTLRVPLRSDDLRHWHNLGSSTLAELQFEATRIEQRRVSLVAKISDYLRITWKDMPGRWKLNAVTGINTEQGLPAPRDWLILDNFAPGESERELVFDVGGYPPADRVNVLLPDDNVVVRASVFHRRDEKDSWRLAHNGIFYNISRQGSALQSPAAAVRDVRAGQWKIRIDSGMTTGPVRLQLGWRPDRLVFLAQGSQPFELVTGRAQDALEQFPSDN